MKAVANVNAGVCGFHTKITAVSEDGQNVSFEIKSGCEKIRSFTDEISRLNPIDAYQEISPQNESQIIIAARNCLKGCCAGCAVTLGIFKAMQVASGLALPRDVEIKISTGISE